MTTHIPNHLPDVEDYEREEMERVRAKMEAELGVNKPNPNLLDNLFAGWLSAKRREQKANEERLNIEGQIYTALAIDEQRDNGTPPSRIDSPNYRLILTYPKRRVWDQDGLMSPQANALREHPAFPFDFEYIEDRKRTAKLEAASDVASKNYLSQLEKYLTIKEGKPGFKVEKLEPTNKE